MSSDVNYWRLTNGAAVTFITPVSAQRKKVNLTEVMLSHVAEPFRSFFDASGETKNCSMVCCNKCCFVSVELLIVYLIEVVTEKQSEQQRAGANMYTK